MVLTVRRELLVRVTLERTLAGLLTSARQQQQLIGALVNRLLLSVFISLLTKFLHRSAPQATSQ